MSVLGKQIVMSDGVLQAERQSNLMMINLHDCSETYCMYIQVPLLHRICRSVCLHVFACVCMCAFTYVCEHLPESPLTLHACMNPSGYNEPLGTLRPLRPLFLCVCLSTDASIVNLIWLNVPRATHKEEPLTSSSSSIPLTHNNP